MTDYATARINMVENQVRPNRVADQRVLAAMAEVPRERFVPKKYQGLAYVDEDIAVARGRCLMEPLVLARLLDAAAIRPEDVVLDIGCATGYSSAVLARLANTVVALESDAGLAEDAVKILGEIDADNVAVITGALEDGYPEQAPYDVIVLGGAVDEVPPAITDQLAEGGRLVAVVTGGGRVGKGTLTLRARGRLSSRVVFDAAVAPLPGFSIDRGFVF
ncbi:MAG: protein-L-isoaspartate O-methyltransferase [Proteobacteria bacterium]|nr:protein-L-isoaspartate O-methyltransferase [Pseudomonadota bacterium]